LARIWWRWRAQACGKAAPPNSFIGQTVNLFVAEHILIWPK